MICNNLYDIFNEEINIIHLSSYRLLTKKDAMKSYVCSKGMRVYSRFFLVLNGETNFVFNTPDGKEKTLNAISGDVVYLPSDIEYKSSWKDADNIDYISINFDIENQSHEPVLLNSGITIVAHDKYGIFKNSFEKLYDVFTAGALGYRLKCRSQFFDILGQIAMEDMKSEYKNTDSSIYKSIIYIENNYMEEISVTELAKMSNMCETSFRMKFNKLKGMPPIEYKNYLRIQKAAELLLNQEYTVTEAAEAVNIPDICYFSKLFKRYYKISPREYKNR